MLKPYTAGRSFSLASKINGIENDQLSRTLHKKTRPALYFPREDIHKVNDAWLIYQVRFKHLRPLLVSLSIILKREAYQSNLSPHDMPLT
jgi:hypothetical protein